MKKLILFSLFFSSIVYCQEKTNDKVAFRPDIAITFISNFYFGDNYLAKGHRSQSVGAQIKSDWLHYNNFNLGIGFEKSTQSVTDYSIGGNIDKTNTNSIILYLSYDLLTKSKFRISPEISYGNIELRQKDGSKFYGSQNGNRYGFGANLNYMLGKYFSLYSNVSLNFYNLNVQTTDEYTNYFNHANAISMSFGIKFH